MARERSTTGTSTRTTGFIRFALSWLAERSFHGSLFPRQRFLIQSIGCPLQGAFEHLREPQLRIYTAVKLGLLQQRNHGSGTLTTAIGACKKRDEMSLVERPLYLSGEGAPVAASAAQHWRFSWQAILPLSSDWPCIRKRSRQQLGWQDEMARFVSSDSA